ncbi:MAG: tetraacyldisaccharide 4'-kinase [Desulfobacteraceae bacterium]|nr:tetraacyldisaccharide 4'-kinase [Desulfobacteraceae bacterium]
MTKGLAAKIETIMSRPVAEDRLFSLGTLLGLASKVYGVVVKARVALYRAGVLKSKKLPCFVISVGNITAGGTGKTPMTLYVADLVARMGYKVAVVSRGYRGKFEQSGGVVRDGQTICCTPEESGDEPYLIARTLGVPVLVGKDRYAVGMKAVREFDAQVIVLDDAFQHIKLKRDLDLVLLDAGHPFGNGALIPRGRLREPVSSLERSDARVLTRWDQASAPVPLPLSGPGTKSVPVFKTSHVSFIRHTIDDREKGSTLQPGDWSRVRGKSCFLFSGLANNESFRNSCEKKGMKIAGFIEFPDHFWYSRAAVDSIRTGFRNSGADVMVTTEKDYVKIESRFSLSPLVVVGVRIGFDPDAPVSFESFVKNRLRSHAFGCGDPLNKNSL